MAAFVFADLEALLAAWLPGAVPGIRAVTDLPANLAAALAAPTNPRGIVQVEAFGGADFSPAAEAVNVDVDNYVAPDGDGEPDRAAAHDLARDLREAFLFQLPGYVDGPATVQRVATVSRPTIRPYDESPVRRFHASYRITVATRG